MIMQVVDGTNMIFGRVATRVAKALITGEEVRVVNAEKLVMLGNPRQISERFAARRAAKHKGTPERSPAWPRVPHMLVKRMIRGMLPKESSRGRDALRRLRVYSGNPKKLEINMKVDGAAFDGLGKHLTIRELCRGIGHKG